MAVPAYYGKTRFNNKYFFRNDPKKTNGHLFNVSPKLPQVQAERKVRESFITKFDGKEDLMGNYHFNPQTDGEDQVIYESPQPKIVGVDHDPSLAKGKHKIILKRSENDSPPKPFEGSKADLINMSIETTPTKINKKTNFLDINKLNLKEISNKRLKEEEYDRYVYSRDLAERMITPKNIFNQLLI